ncbi:ABC transporter ATP-binding protein [Galactobacter valiniphilus]|uniref:ABC transporter ATP-binding protein n=1 Tax=Galactobacter valiniphilus TaxID=2676122 RepID=A0A399JES1_9MICC|nr:ABC transporter ATP-binding protein [Galactobacter valiniphilus]RII41046.1 ABC transporter ATP-binding protein [Galactobacter valiniphilus]
MNSSALARLIPLLRPERAGLLRSFAASMASALCLTALGVLAAWAVGRAVVLHAAPPAWLWPLVAALVVLRAVLTWREMDVSHVMAFRVLARLRLSLFDAFSRARPTRRGRHSGREASTLLTDTERLEFFYAHTVAQIAAQAVVAVGCIVAATAVRPVAGVVVLVGALALVAATRLSARAGRRAGEAEQEAREALSGRISEVVTATREVLSNAMVSRVLRDALALTERNNRADRTKALVITAASGLREVIVGAVAVCVLLLGVVHAAGDRDSAAVLAPLLVVTLAGLAAVADAATTLTQLQPLEASAARVAGAIADAPATPEGEKPTGASPAAMLPAGPLGIRLRDVRFAYEDEDGASGRLGGPGVNLDVLIEPGEHVGVRGPSGAGKSTLLGLMARLLTPQAGSLELLGVDGGRISLGEPGEGELRARVAYVGQRATLFSGTVRENLLMGLPESQTAPTDAELLGLLGRLGLEGIVTLEAPLGEDGLRLSGGQRARVCLARAIVGEPSLLLVDEVTASLDAAAESAITEVLAWYPCTVVLVSHRPSTLGTTDRVIDVAAPAGPG